MVNSRQYPEIYVSFVMAKKNVKCPISQPLNASEDVITFVKVVICEIFFHLEAHSTPHSAVICTIM